MVRGIEAALARHYPAGTVLFREDEPGSRMFVIRKGRVKIFRSMGERELVLAFLSDGDFFGEMALLEGLPRSASAVLVEDSTLVEVDMTMFESMVRNNSEIAVRIMQKLASRVRQLDQRLETLVTENAVGRALDVLRWLLPQGERQGDWTRVVGGTTQFDIAAQAAIPAKQAETVLLQLERARCMKRDGGDLLIAASQTLLDYANYLDMRRKYELMGLEDEVPVEATEASVEQDGLRMLLAALKLADTDAQGQHDKLDGEYERYRGLRERFAKTEKKA